jgi:Na+:H+ antiporter, NhaA family
MVLFSIREFLRLEAAGGILLMAAAVIALVWANSPASAIYISMLDLPVVIQVGEFKIAKPLLLWVNDGLMAVFFLLIGLEIKREVLEGELSSLSRIALPGIAAAGGMIVPSAIYLLFNAGDSIAVSGWAIPAATDIAFALAVLALLGDRAAPSLKVLLLAVAIMDDLGAIVIIALFYTSNLSFIALALAGLGAVLLVVLNLTGVIRVAAYVLVGVFLWACVLKSGVHATLAGVATGFAIPLRTREETIYGDSPLRHLEHILHPWVVFGILPFFALANAGVPLAGLSLASLFGPVPLGIAAGLFLGKQIGVLGASWVAIRSGVGALPEGASWTQFYGMSLLTGIGFTMSLFIGGLAFADERYSAAVRIGVLGGSLLSAVAGYLVIYFTSKASPAPRSSLHAVRDGASEAGS